MQRQACNLAFLIAGSCQAALCGEDLHSSQMGRRPAVAAIALAGLLLAVMAASSGTGAAGLERSLGVRSVLVSVVVTLAGLGLVAALYFLVSSLLRRGGGQEGEREKVPVPLAAKVAAVLLLAAMAAAVYLIFSSLHPAHPRPPQAAFGPGPQRAQPKAGKPVPFNGTASYLTAVVVVVAVALAAGRKRLALLLSHRRPFAPSDRQPAGPPVPARWEGPPARDALPDPAAIADPRLAVLAAYARFAALMELAGRPRRAPETVHEYESRLQDLAGLRRGGARAAAAELSELFATARYGSGPLDEAARARALGDLREIERQLAPSP